MKNSLTVAELRSRLSYDPSTGVFHWLNGPRAGRVAGCVCGSTGYIHIKLNRYQYLAHRLAWLYHYGEWPEGECDHKNRQRSSNWIANLRDATSSQNKANSAMKSNNTSGFRGVSFNKARGKYRADIRVNGIKKTIGYYDDAFEASRQYNLAAASAFGSFALVGKET